MLIYIWKVGFLCCRERTKMPLKGSGTKGQHMDQRRLLKKEKPK